MRPWVGLLSQDSCLDSACRSPDSFSSFAVIQRVIATFQDAALALPHTTIQLAVFDTCSYHAYYMNIHICIVTCPYI